MKKAKCPNCGALEGQFHELGCGKEICPFCDCQLLFCGCWEEKLTELGFQIPEEEDEDDFEVELPDEWNEKWLNILNEKGRVAFIEKTEIEGFVPKCVERRRYLCREFLNRIISETK